MFVQHLAFLDFEVLSNFCLVLTRKYIRWVLMRNQTKRFEVLKLEALPGYIHLAGSASFPSFLKMQRFLAVCWEGAVRVSNLQDAGHKSLAQQCCAFCAVIISFDFFSLYSQEPHCKWFCRHISAKEWRADSNAVPRHLSLKAVWFQVPHSVYCCVSFLCHSLPKTRKASCPSYNALNACAVYFVPCSVKIDLGAFFRQSFSGRQAECRAALWNHVYTVCRCGRCPARPPLPRQYSPETTLPSSNVTAVVWRFEEKTELESPRPCGLYVEPERRYCQCWQLEVKESSWLNLNVLSSMHANSLRLRLPCSWEQLERVSRWILCFTGLKSKHTSSGAAKLWSSFCGLWDTRVTTKRNSLADFFWVSF